MKIDFSTAFGLAAGVIIIAIGIISTDGNLYWFANGIALLIVLGGTFSATLVNYPIKNVFTSEWYDYHSVIKDIVIIADKARKKGVHSLEDDLNKIDDKFLRKGIELAINERDTKRLRTFLSLEMDNIARRHNSVQEIFFYMGSYAPAFGMLGTIMGLIIMMISFSGAESLGQIETIDFDIAEKFATLLGGMGMALITTFYGVLFSNLVFLPIGGKLKRKSEDELMLRNIILEGIMSIHAKEHPILIQEKLMTFVQESKRTAK